MRCTFQEDFDSYFGKEFNHFLVACDREQKEVLGCVAISKNSPSDSYHELRRMRVKKSSRGLGIGSKLVERAEQIMTSQGSKGCVLSTTDLHLPARGLYIKQGCSIDKTQVFCRLGFLPGFEMIVMHMSKTF